MPRSEAAITQDLIVRLRREGAFAEKVHGGPRQRKGMPDIVATFDGFSVWIEVKVPGKDATPIQAAVLEELRGAGGWAAVIRSVAELDDLLSLGPGAVCKGCLQSGCASSHTGTDGAASA